MSNQNIRMFNKNKQDINCNKMISIIRYTQLYEDKIYRVNVEHNKVFKIIQLNTQRYIYEVASLKPEVPIGEPITTYWRT